MSTILLRGGETTQELREIPASLDEESGLLWIDAESPTDEEIRALQKRFNLDSYAVEDVLHGKQRPKIEDYKTFVFSVIHIPVEEKKTGGGELAIIELFVFFGNRWLITVHKREAEVVHDVDKRVRARGLAPLSEVPSPDLLYYIFLDFAVDSFYPRLDQIEDKIEKLEERGEQMLRAKRKEIGNAGKIISVQGKIRNDLMTLRRAVSPVRDMLGMVMRGSIPFVKDSSLRNFRDIYDHTFQLIETIDSYRDRMTDVRDLFISLIAISTDNIIKVLTIVATIFLPLSLLAGIYGTNFTPGFFEPGSSVWFGFYLLMIAMIVIALGMLYLFRRAGWI